MVTKIKVCLAHFYVFDSDRWWGAADWYLHGLVDGQALGDPDQRFEARSGMPLVLGDGWEIVVNTAGKAPGSSVLIRLWAIHSGVFSNTHLGEVQARIFHPFI